MPTGNGQASFSTDEAAPREAEAHEGHVREGEEDSGLRTAVATVAVVAVGAAVFEAALLPGIAPFCTTKFRFVYPARAHV